MKPDLIHPVSAIISQPFGVNGQFYSDPKYGGIKGHNGLDYLTNTGWAIYATHDGFAEYQIDPAGGHGVVITAKDGSYKTIYWHLTNPEEYPHYTSPIYGKTNVPVNTGDIIGYSDNTGASTGPHLHYGLKFCKDGQTLNLDNGFRGAVDPTPYCNGYTPQQYLALKSKVTILKKLVELWTRLKEITNGNK